MDGTARRLLLPLGAGILGALFLTGIYLGIVSLAESPVHALELFWQDKVFVIPILLGFGTQVGLFTLLKKGLHMPIHVPGAGASTAAGGGMSTAAMVACCAHHIADVLPLVGLSAAAALLANWKIPFMTVGLATNLLGIVIMLREIRKQRRMVIAHMGVEEAKA